MADFSLGNAGVGHIELWENWNSPDQVSVHYKLSVNKSGSWYSNSGGSWNGNYGGVRSNSGGFNYASGNQYYVLWEEDYTFNKDANGNIGGIGAYGYINGDNSPGVGAGSGSVTIYPGRIGRAPEGIAKSVDTITNTSARFGAKQDNNGKGTSSANRVYYRLNNTGGWSQTSDQGGTGWKYWTITLGQNSMYGYFSRHWNNNGDTADTGTSTFVTLASATEVSKEILATTVSFDMTATTGYYTPTTVVQYRQTDGSPWTNSTGVTGGTPQIELTGLVPNAEYEYRLMVTTTAGTWHSTTSTFTTLPAASLVYPNGDVKNAIPRVVQPNGDVLMVNVNIVEP